MSAGAETPTRWVRLTPGAVEGIRVQGNTATLNPDYWTGTLNGESVDLKWKKTPKQSVQALTCSCSGGSGSCHIETVNPGQGDGQVTQARCVGGCSGGACTMGYITVKVPVGP